MTDHAEQNRRSYNTDDVVAEYTEARDLIPCETMLFERYVPEGSDVLDLGVGAGRTTPFLAARAKRYVGVDYADRMVEYCQKQWPELEFHVDDAADLSRYADSSFDTVVFSYNGIDTLYPDEARHACLDEIARVLRPDGTFVFSRRNPRALLEPRSGHGGGGARPWTPKAAVADLRRLRRALTERSFWRGQGYTYSKVHGGQLCNLATPEHVRRELAAHGYAHRETVGANHPAASPSRSTYWYYYAAAHP
jgi:SAM-dependent methyltransferase